MTYLFESLPNEITVSSARGVLGGALNDKGGGAVGETIHAKSERYLRYISAIFFGFSAKF